MQNKKEQKFAFVLFIAALLVGFLAILGVDKSSFTGFAVTKIIEYSGNPVFMLVVAIGIICIIALLYSYLFMKGW